jgi:pyruvate kinase
MAQFQPFTFLGFRLKVVTPADSTHTVAIAAVEAAFKSQAAAIITLTTSGTTAHLMAKYIPRCPIIAVTRNEQVARQCHLWRGILPLHFSGWLVLN